LKIPASLLAVAAAFGVMGAGVAHAGGSSYPASNPKTVSGRGRAFIQQEEGFRSKAYKDGRNAAGLQLYSIGYGHQITGRDGLTKDSVINHETADLLFTADVASREALIRKLVRVPLRASQFDALASLAYNIGNGAFEKSALLRLLNAGDYAGARAQFAEWNKSGGAVNPVLVGRRQREANMFAT
jgi:lysozyme